MSLDINKLIEVAEGVFYDSQLEFVEKISQPVQTVSDERGRLFELSIVLKLVVNNKSITEPLPSMCIVGTSKGVECHKVNACEWCKTDNQNVQ